MITRHRRLDLPDTYPLERIGPLSDLLFFDIETTGFSGDTSRLYLIGCTYYRDGGWNLIQWFADSPGSEAALLHSFFAFMKDYRTLVHFNGDTFDIPYLLKCCRRLKLPYDFSQVESFDIYKRIKPYRKILGLDSMKQKAIEQFLGVSRTDLYSGGQLIEVYHDYLATHEDLLYDMLILHNEDDLKGMPLILPILSYPDFLEHPLRLLNQRILEGGCPDPAAAGAGSPDPAAAGISRPGPGSAAAVAGQGGRRLELVCESDYPVPVPFRAFLAPVACLVDANRMTLTVDLFEGSLKHFYPNYKDYYYLLYEDAAVHKSVGEYVDKSARVPATAKTCYTRREGCFLPQFEPVWEPVMRRELKDKLCYADLQDVCLQDPGCLNAYLRQLLSHLGAKL